MDWGLIQIIQGNPKNFDFIGSSGDFISRAMEIEIDGDAPEEDMQQVFGWLRDFNHAENGPFMKALDTDAQKEFTIVARDSDGNLLGGICGNTTFHWLKIEIMAVSPNHRRKGVGEHLVQAAEKHGSVNGCQHAYVDTISYQAPEFYRKLGYREVGRLPNWDSQGHDKLFFMKELQHDR